MDVASDNRRRIAHIKKQYVTGRITRDEAKELAQPVLKRINEATKVKTKELNQKYNTNRKPAILDFVNAMRNGY